MFESITTTLEKESAFHKIPKIIHFIWVGVHRLPKKNMQRILGWQAANPNFAVYLWIDKKGTSEAIWKAYESQFQALKVDLNFPQELSIPSIKCIEEEKISEFIIRHEIDQLLPNYGAASDLLRYRLLYRYGGAYFDCDILNGKNSLQESGLFEAEHPSHIIYVDLNSGKNGMGFAGNDALISTKGNPHLKQIYQLACRYYQSPILETTDLSAFTDKNPTAMQLKFGSEVCWQMLAYESSTIDKIKELTIRRSGPCCLRDVVQIGGVTSFPGKIHPGIAPLPEDLRAFIDDSTTEQVDTPNEASWLENMKLKELDLPEAIDSAVKTASFEINQMNMLRLDDYIDMLFYSIVPEYPDLQELISIFISKLSLQTDLDFSALRYVQYPYRYGYAENHPLLSHFCREKGIYAKAEMMLFPKIPTNAQIALARSVAASIALELIPQYSYAELSSRDIIEQGPLIFNKNPILCINGGINFLQHAIAYCKTLTPALKSEHELTLDYVNNLIEIVDLYQEHQPKYKKIDMAKLEKLSIELRQQYKRLETNSLSPESYKKEKPASTLKEKIFNE